MKENQLERDTSVGSQIENCLSRDWKRIVYDFSININGFLVIFLRMRKEKFINDNVKNYANLIHDIHYKLVSQSLFCKLKNGGLYQSQETSFHSCTYTCENLQTI